MTKYHLNGNINGSTITITLIIAIIINTINIIRSALRNCHLPLPLARSLSLSLSLSLSHIVNTIEVRKVITSFALPLAHSRISSVHASRRSVQESAKEGCRGRILNTE
jgi:hypothetical protein